jgi:RHS repeat-associated protein
MRTYSYDASGNTTSDGGRTFTYSAAGRMISSTTSGVTTSYLYSGLGERVKKANSNGTMYFAYDEDGHLLGEYDASGNLIQETVWLDDIPVATLRPNGSSGIDVYYVHTDHLNTPRRITRPSDDVIVWRWDSDPFGATAANEDPDGDTQTFGYNLRFPGQYFDEETGLHYNYFRDYDAVTGRYFQSDPIGLNGGINTYAYVSDNPISYFDPAGLQTMCRAVLTTAGGLVGGAAGFACGCALGGVAGGAGGSLIAPGVGTVGGAITGCGAAGPAVGALGALFGAAAGNAAADAVCGDEDPDRCERAKTDARSRYNRLVTKRIPQYQSGGTGGSDAGHYQAILQLQAALKDAIRRVRLYCLVLPPELPEWERAANQIIPPQH